MFRKFRQEVTLLLFLLTIMFSSCSYPDENMVTILLPTYLPIIDISGESPYMDLYVFDGEKTYHRFVRSGLTEITVPIVKGRLSLFTLKPYGKYSSVSTFLEPGNERPPAFAPENSQMIEFLTDVASHNPLMIADLGFSALLELFPETEKLDKMKTLEFLENWNPEDPLIPDLSGKLFEIEIDTYIPGLWKSDRADMSDFMISHTTDKLVLELYEGVYHYFHEDGKHHLMIVVTDTGKHTSRLDYTVW